METVFKPGMFNLHTTGLTDTTEKQPLLSGLTEPYVYGLSWWAVLGQAVLCMIFTLSFLFLFFFT